MKLNLNAKEGFTLTEIVFSLVLLVSVWMVLVNSMVMSGRSGSFAKHKAQAIQVIQRTIEDTRKKSFASIASIPSSSVSIDTRGTPDNYADDFQGTQIVTVTSLGYYKKVVVEVRWNETVFGVTKMMREYCGTYIANDPQAN